MSAKKIVSQTNGARPPPTTTKTAPITIEEKNVFTNVEKEKLEISLRAWSSWRVKYLGGIFSG